MSEAKEVGLAQEMTGKIAKMISAQAAGTPSGFSTEDLNHVYLDLVQEKLCDRSKDLLEKMIGADYPGTWDSMWSVIGEDKDDKDNLDQALAYLLSSISPKEVATGGSAIETMAYALMVASKELGWIATSRQAHKQWFAARGPHE